MQFGLGWVRDWTDAGALASLKPAFTKRFGRTHGSKTMVALANLIANIIGLYMWAVIISVVLTWLVQFNVINTSNRLVYQIGDFLYRITEPVMRPIRQVIPSIGGIDLSPLIVILILGFLQQFIPELLLR